jgi:short subunit fatty acids transporter
MSVGVILHIRKNTSGVFSLHVYILDSLSVFSVHAILCIFGNDLVNKDHSKIAVISVYAEGFWRILYNLHTIKYFQRTLKLR